MQLNLTNKVAIVTGASRGIGRALAEVLAQEDLRLVVPARSLNLLQEIANAVAFLASAQYCQGTILDIDGGQTKTL